MYNVKLYSYKITIEHNFAVDKNRITRDCLCHGVSNRL